MKGEERPAVRTAECEMDAGMLCLMELQRVAKATLTLRLVFICVSLSAVNITSVSR